ncbi:hypothetical protein ACWEF9_33315 [Streptomyces sp. NPDC004980]
MIDEFRTYDGAQGTDVAMLLLRRLGAVVGAAGEGRPLGSICPVATSATLGESPVRDQQDQGGAGSPPGHAGRGLPRRHGSSVVEGRRVTG